jgi:hypothetical protein
MHKFIMEEIKEQAKSPSGYEGEKPAPKAEETHDDFGYPKTDAPAPKAEAPKEEPKKEEPPAEKEIVAATGYGEEPPKIEEPKKEEKPPETAAEAAKELDIDVKDLPEDDAKSIREFAKKHNVTKEVAQAMADMKKAEHVELNQAIEDRRQQIEQQKKKTMVDWHNELKNDSTFGGEKFAYNIKQAEKVIDQFMPNLKTRLLQDKQMLPPYIMKDLAKLAKHLYSTEKLTQGEPVVQTKENDDKEDHLAFYT